MILHCLNLKITYDCSNHCSFCFSSYMRDTVIPLESLKKAVIQGHENGCNELVLSGGEPTLYPNYIMELINLAESLNYKKYIIQTNGYGLSKYDELVSFLDNLAKKTEICLSFSVHGHLSSIHNDLCGNSNAFKSLINAIDKISKTHCNIYTNTVINALNIDHLKEIAILLLPYSPEIMQFSIMHLEEKSNLSVSFENSVRAVKELKNIVSLDILKTEGIPYCLLHGMEQCVGESAWPTVLDLYNADNVYMKDFKQLDYGMRSKMLTCDKCLLDKICMGVWKEHFEEFLSMNIHPIR